ncbi:unnamed protein product [Trichogramma brassicae]|uniref:Uncharacterized protein n=1 Tax=Trichogramma brassicae TaxID=86971 RepID=A0A6H5J6X5_9HYME|nr:unnamed protein product [Trichogramma brassicae]
MKSSPAAQRGSRHHRCENEVTQREVPRGDREPTLQLARTATRSKARVYNTRLHRVFKALRGIARFRALGSVLYKPKVCVYAYTRCADVHRALQIQHLQAFFQVPWLVLLQANAPQTHVPQLMIISQQIIGCCWRPASKSLVVPIVEKIDSTPSRKDVYRRLDDTHRVTSKIYAVKRFDAVLEYVSDFTRRKMIAELQDHNTPVVRDSALPAASMDGFDDIVKKFFELRLEIPMASLSSNFSMCLAVALDHKRVTEFLLQQDEPLLTNISFESLQIRLRGERKDDARVESAQSEPGIRSGVIDEYKSKLDTADAARTRLSQCDVFVQVSRSNNTSRFAHISFQYVLQRRSVNNKERSRRLWQVVLAKKHTNGASHHRTTPREAANRRWPPPCCDSIVPKLRLICFLSKSNSTVKYYECITEVERERTRETLQYGLHSPELSNRWRFCALPSAALISIISSMCKIFLSVYTVCIPLRGFSDCFGCVISARLLAQFSSASNRERLYYIPVRQREKCRRGYIHSYLYLPSVRARSNIIYARVCNKYNETRRAHLCRYSQLQRRQ